ncbi:MAG: hypothetical protein ACREFM_25180, partial [Hypericibacter sp.]
MRARLDRDRQVLRLQDPHADELSRAGLSLRAIDTCSSPRLTARPSGNNPSIRSGEEAIMPMQHRARSIPAVHHLSKTIFAGIAAAMLIGLTAIPHAACAGDVPTFAVEASWPKPLPNNWILGQVGGITVDSKDHIWVIHRPRSLTDDENGAALKPPRSKCCVSAPPVLEFDAEGNLLRSWGGAGEGYEWVGREHGIEVDEKGFVWVGGNADNDNAILKFTLDGKFVMQIGKIAPSKGSSDTTQLGKPAETAIDKEANEIYVADGYGNRRVIVFDATSGAYK